MPSSSGSPALSCPFLQPRGNSTSVLRKRSPVTTGKGIQMKFLTTAAVAAAFVFGAHAAHAGATFDAVKAKGFLQCGVNTGLGGFAAPDSKEIGRASCGERGCQYV